MYGATMQYEYRGDEAAWDATITTFVQEIDADQDISGRFIYRVTKAKNGYKRIHWGQWDAPATLERLQSRDYFKTFVSRLQELHKGKLEPTLFSVVHSTKG